MTNETTHNNNDHLAAAMNARQQQLTNTGISFTKASVTEYHTFSRQQKPTLILKARLKPLAKKPPNGPMRDANTDMEIE